MNVEKANAVQLHENSKLIIVHSHSLSVVLLVWHKLIPLLSFIFDI